MSDRRGLGAEDGIAVPLTVSALLLTLVLAAAVGDVSVRSSSAATEDAASKRALAAADAGLQHGQNWLASMNAPGQCAGDAVTTVAGTECPWSGWKPLGNGAEYRFVVGATTVGPCPLLPGKSVQEHDRCITAQGRVGTVVRRLQMRVNAPPPQKPFKDVALFGDRRIVANNSNDLFANVGSNFDVLAANSLKIGSANKIHLPPAPTGTLVMGNGAKVPAGVRVDATQTQWQQPDFEAAENANDNARLAPYLNATTKILTVPDGVTLNLPTGTYYTCGVRMLNSAKITVPAGGSALVFVDSPARRDAAGAKLNSCPDRGTQLPTSQSGRVTTVNSNDLNMTAPEDADRLTLFVHGSRGSFYPGVATGTNVANAGDANCNAKEDPSADVDFLNSVRFVGRIYGPDATIRLCNSVDVVGGVLGREVKLMNSNVFRSVATNAEWKVPGTGTARQSGWFECRSTAATLETDPESGCT